MAITVSQRAQITQDVPSKLVALEVPPGVSLEKFVEQETERLRNLYPAPKVNTVELGPEIAEMLQIARANLHYWEERYALVKLAIREELGFAKKGLNGGVPFVDRRQFPVSEYHVEPFEQDAIYPV